MLLLAGTLLAVLLVRPLGGRLRPLAGLRLHGAPLVPVALLAQVLAFVVLSGAPRPVLLGLHVVSYLLAAVFVWLNRALPGLWLLAGGAGLNALVLALNDGTMPASAEAVRRAGLPLVDEGYSNSGVLADPHLAPLGDVFASPAWLPLHNVYSPGDLLVLAGVVWAVHRTCGTVLARDPRPALATLRRPGTLHRPGTLRRPAGQRARSVSQPGTSSAGIGRLTR